ncbi:MAG: hypothetical protein AAGJ83_03655 [Planctomycetota bacterium]
MRISRILFSLANHDDGNAASWRNVWALRLAILLGISAIVPLSPDKAIADELSSVDLSAHVYPLEFDGDQIHGPGVEWVENRAANCQFVLFGEQHGIAGLPEIVSAIYSRLQPKGFDRFIMERGPWISRRLSREGVEASLSRAPYSVAFDYDGEVQLLHNVETRYRGEGDAFWGVDQALTAIHPLQRLSEILPTFKSRRTARGLFLKDALQGGKFFRSDHSAEIESLRRLSGAAMNEEGTLLIDALAKSNEIFSAYHKETRNSDGVWESDIVREQYMMDQFDRYMAEVARLGSPSAKALLKMGGAHVMRGIGPNRVRTLGDHIHQTSLSNGTKTLHISIRGHSSESGWPDEVFSDARYVLIDSSSLAEPVRELPPSAKVEELLRDVMQYDAILLLKDPIADKSSEINRYEADFRRSLISELAWGLLPLTLLLSLLVPLTRKLCFGATRSDWLDPFLPWVCLASLSVVFITIVFVQILRLRSWSTPQVSRLSDSPWMLILESLSVLVSVFLVFLMWRKSWWSRAQRIHFVVVAAGLVGFAAFTHYWNLGRMLG